MYCLSGWGYVRSVCTVAIYIGRGFFAVVVCWWWWYTGISSRAPGRQGTCWLNHWLAPVMFSLLIATHVPGCLVFILLVLRLHFCVSTSQPLPLWQTAGNMCFAYVLVREDCTQQLSCQKSRPLVRKSANISKCIVCAAIRSLEGRKQGGVIRGREGGRQAIVYK